MLGGLDARGWTRRTAEGAVAGRHTARTPRHDVHTLPRRRKARRSGRMGGDGGGRSDQPDPKLLYLTTALVEAQALPNNRFRT